MSGHLSLPIPVKVKGVRPVCAFGLNGMVRLNDDETIAADCAKADAGGLGLSHNCPGVPPL
jgi:hypothetical protein